MYSRNSVIPPMVVMSFSPMADAKMYSITPLTVQNETLKIFEIWHICEPTRVGKTVLVKSDSNLCMSPRLNLNTLLPVPQENYSQRAVFRSVQPRRSYSNLSLRRPNPRRRSPSYPCRSLSSRSDELRYAWKGNGAVIIVTSTIILIKSVVAIKDEGNRLIGSVCHPGLADSAGRW